MRSNGLMRFDLKCVEKMQLGTGAPLERCQREPNHMGPHTFKATDGKFELEVRWKRVDKNG
jgi:hypothetical protein